MIKFFLFLCMIFTFELSLAQGTRPPIGGWDSLRKVLVYPDLAKRAQLSGMALVKVWIDTTGVVDSVDIPWSDADVFNEPVINAVKSVRWTPGTGMHKGRPISFPVMFLFKGANYPYLQIEAEAPPNIKSTH